MRRVRALYTSELVARATLHRQLVDGVLELPEPYQSTLLMRFFDDLPPREIAERTSRPVETVRTHIARGLERVRQALDRVHGDRSSWTMWLMPLLRPTSSVASASLLTRAVILLTLIVPTAAAVVLWMTFGADTTPVPVTGAPIVVTAAEPIADGQDPTREQVPSKSVDSPPVGDIVLTSDSGSVL